MELYNLIIQLSTIIASVGAIAVVFNKIFDKKLKPLEISNLKTDLVNFITDLENGISKNDIQKLNACEMYDRYTKLGGNSYIHSHWEKLEKEGLI